MNKLQGKWGYIADTEVIKAIEAYVENYIPIFLKT